LEARIAKDRGKRVERTAGYDNDEDALRRGFGTDTELDELEALVASWIQEEDMVGRSRSEIMATIREGWLVQHGSKTMGRRNRMLMKPIERIGRMVLSPLADRVYICN